MMPVNEKLAPTSLETPRRDRVAPEDVDVTVEAVVVDGLR